MRRAARKDNNHKTIARVLTDVGCEVIDLSTAPGCLDMLVGFRGKLSILEVKQPQCRDDLTELEAKTIERLRRVDAPVFVVCSADEALKAVGAL